MGVGVGAGSNNSARTFCSVVGGCIRLAGTGCNTGHTGGRTTPRGAQAHTLSAQISSKLACIGFSIGLVLFVLIGSEAEAHGLRMLGNACGFGLLQRVAQCRDL